MDPDVKRVFSDDEDDEGDSRKILAAQYQIFRQAVTTSKGSFKVNPAKTKRASGASLLDLGDSEVTDRVTWLDQPSFQDTMVSTARIAQGLKDDEEVEKSTLSETLNTAFSTFKFFTVKQFSPGNLTVSRLLVMLITCPSLLVTTESVTTRHLLPTRCHIGRV